MKFEAANNDVELIQELSHLISLADDLFRQHEERYLEIERRRNFQSMPTWEKSRIPTWESDLKNLGGRLGEDEHNFQHAFNKLKILNRHLEEGLANQRSIRKQDGKIQILSGGEWKNIEDELAAIEVGLSKK